MNWKKGLFAFMLMLVLAALAACSSDDVETASSATVKDEEEVATTVVKVGLLNSLSNSSIYLGDKEGIFEKHGIEIEYVPFQAAQPIAVAAQTGDIHVGSGALTAGFFNLLAQDANIKLVADSGREAEGHRLTALVASNAAYEAGLTSLEDLKGKKFGITSTGSSQHIAIGQMLETIGLTIDDIELVTLGGISNIAAALESNQIDAGLLLSTAGTPLIDSGKVQLISWVGDVVEMQTTGVYFGKAMLNDEELATRFLAAYLESVKYYHETILGNADQESESYKQSVATLAEATGIAPELIAANPTYVDPNGEVWKENMQTWVNWFGDNGLLTGEINVDNIIATDLYEKALTSIK